MSILVIGGVVLLALVRDPVLEAEPASSVVYWAAMAIVTFLEVANLVRHTSARLTTQALSVGSILLR